MPPEGKVGRPSGPERSPVMLRLDPLVVEAVKRLAATDLRSANAEFEVLLREALKRRGVTLGVTPPAT